MLEINVTYTMNKRDHFISQLEILYRALKNAIILAGSVFVLFWVVFFIDFGVNGVIISWGITASMLYIAVVFVVMVAVYAAYSPLHAWVKSRLIARDNTQVTPIEVKFGKDKITVTTSDGSKRYLSWFDLRLFRNTKNFLMLRDRTKKNQIGFLMVPKSALTEVEVKSILRYREEVIRREEIKRNPVARERARQIEEREKRNAMATGDTQEATQEAQSEGENPERERELGTAQEPQVLPPTPPKDGQ